jgi:peptidoglycan/LPS O-acetylase OafA/YrhL
MNFSGMNKYKISSDTVHRHDIDGLRAIAVFLVIFFHASPQWMPGGFIGVDIFFVISGYLISDYIFKKLISGNFSFKEFYFRRFIRITPALLLVLTAVLTFGCFTLLASEYENLGRYVVAGTLFLTNLLSWSDTGYFDTKSDEKPLLHLWSLGVEEQFYLIWPIILIIFYYFSKKLIILLITIVVLSFNINIHLISIDPVASFFSPLARFFEFMAGAIIALRRQNFTKSKSTSFQVKSITIVRNEDILSILGAFGIISGLALIDSESIFPGFWVLLPTVGTALLIQAGPSAWINKNILSLQALVSLGLISYPLYLWHLPILTFARLIVGGVPSREIRLLCICVAVGLAWATFRFVEIPIQRRAYHQTFKTLRTTMLSLIVALVAVTVVGGVLVWREGFPERLPVFAGVELAAFETSDESKSGPHFSLCDASLPVSLRCLLSKVPETEKLLVIGDSHGEALASGLYLAIQEIRPSVSIVIQSEGGCSPLRGVESRNQVGISRNCLGKYESVYQWAIEDKSVRTVILASRWAERVGAAVGFGSVDGNLSSGGYSFMVDGKLVDNNSDTFALGLRYTIQTLMDNGKRVVFAHQVPEFGFYPPFCGVRPIPLNSWKDGEERCVIERELVEIRQKEYRNIFDFVKLDFPELVIMDPLPVFCSEIQCRLKKGSMYLYNDDDHLNKLGAYYFSKKYLTDLF